MGKKTKRRAKQSGGNRISYPTPDGRVVEIIGLGLCGKPVYNWQGDRVRHANCDMPLLRGHGVPTLAKSPDEMICRCPLCSPMEWEDPETNEKCSRVELTSTTAGGMCVDGRMAAMDEIHREVFGKPLPGTRSTIREIAMNKAAMNQLISWDRAMTEIE